MTTERIQPRPYLDKLSDWLTVREVLRVIGQRHPPALCGKNRYADQYNLRSTMLGGTLLYYAKDVRAMAKAMDKKQLACLSDEEALKVAELAKRLEAHYGQPQDMEWAIDRKLSFPANVFLVQTRPITVSMDKKKDESTEYIVDLMGQMIRQIRDSEPDPLKNKRK